MAALTGIPEDEWVQAPLAPGFYRPCASRRTMGSAHRAGWFRGEMNAACGSAAAKRRLFYICGASRHHTF